MKKTLILAAMMMAGTALLAQGPGGGMGSGMHGHEMGRGPGMSGEGRLLPPGPWWRNADVVAKVGLSPEQTKHIDQIFLDSRIQLIQMHASLEEEQVRLDDILNATPLDQGKAQASIDKTADLRAGLEKANAKMLLNIRAVLSPDQWTKLQALHGSRHEGEGREPMGHRGSRGPQAPQGPGPQGGAPAGPPPPAE